MHEHIDSKATYQLRVYQFKGSVLWRGFRISICFFLPAHYLSHLLRLEPWQMDRSSCRAWRWASTRAETGTGMVGEAAAPTTAATGVPGVVVGQQPGCNRCRGNCLATFYCVPAAASPTVPVPVSDRVLTHLQARQCDLSICQGSSCSK